MYVMNKTHHVYHLHIKGKDSDKNPSCMNCEVSFKIVFMMFKFPSLSLNALHIKQAMFQFFGTDIINNLINKLLLVLF